MSWKRFELLTTRLEGVSSIQLSYQDSIVIVPKVNRDCKQKSIALQVCLNLFSIQNDPHIAGTAAIPVMPDGTRIQQTNAFNRIIKWNVGMAEAYQVTAILLCQFCKHVIPAEEEIPVAVCKQNMMFSQIEDPMQWIHAISIVIALHTGKACHHGCWQFAVTAVQEGIIVMVLLLQPGKRFAQTVIVRD